MTPEAFDRACLALPGAMAQDMLLARYGQERLDQLPDLVDTGRVAGLIVMGQWSCHEQLNAMARRGLPMAVWGAAVPGTLVNLAAGGEGAATREAVRFGHPSGTLRVGAEAAQDESGQWQVTKALMGRSARILMEGWVRVPGDFSQIGLEPFRYVR